MNILKKRNKKLITTHAEIFGKYDLQEIIKEVNLIYFNIFENEFLQLIKESKIANEYFLKTGNNFFSVIIRVESNSVDIFKNGFFFKSISINSVNVNSDNTIDVKYIPSCRNGDYVEFYLD